MILLGIVLAATSATLLSVGTQLQHRGVLHTLNLDEELVGFHWRHFLHLLRRPIWLLGMVLLTAAVLIHLTSLTLAPLMVIQPIGALALVVSTLIAAKQSRKAPGSGVIHAIVLSIMGVVLFILIAAPISKDPPITDGMLLGVNLALLGALLITGALLLTKRLPAVPLIFLGGIQHGFTALLVKALLSHLLAYGIDWLLILDALGLAISFIIGAYLVQRAYTVAPPDLVLSGLTVIDPIVAVILGMTILGEVHGAPFWVYPAFLLTGGIAIYGVFHLARHRAVETH